MQVHIHAYARLKEFLGSKLSLDIPEGATLGDAIAEITRMNPDSREFIPLCRLAVNRQYVGEDHILKGNEEILLFPPSSGG